MGTTPEDFAQLQERFAKILGRQPTATETKELMADKDEMGLSYHDPLLVQLMAFKRERMALAEQLLGRPYRISGRVVHGAKLGRQIGFPTANIQVKHNRPPLTGIFVTEVHGAADRPLLGAASLGKRPTVDDSGRIALEVYLPDFSGNLYGRHLQVDFLHKLRDEAKYDGLDPLIAQIKLDVENARAFYRERISLPRP